MAHHPRFAPLALCAAAAAVCSGARADKIRDNLFLLEEAYNQEPGVIQHIQSFQNDPRAGTWAYAFTEEWPAPTDRHQLSVTFTALRPEPAGVSGVGDLLLNYRLQVLGMGGAGGLAMAPRLSLVLPTGDPRAGAGRGGFGVQLNVPLSIELGPTFVLHLNAGGTITPAAQSSSGVPAASALLDANAGIALVWLALETFNALVEISYQSVGVVRDDLSVGRKEEWVLNPGVRFALNVSEALQIVPGLSAPIRVQEAGVTVAVLGYLSFEHVLWRPGAPLPERAQ